MDALLVPLCNATGASLDQVKLIACLLVSYPLGSVFIRLPRTQPALKHLFNIAVCTFYFIPMLNLRGGLAQLWLDVLGTYIIAERVRSPRMPWIVFGLLMSHLLVNHFAREMSGLGYETFEITGPQMVLVMKLSTFAWNVHDGRRPISDLDKWQQKKRVTAYPSLLAFLGYAFYFPGALVGPYLDFASYAALVDGSIYTSIERHHVDKVSRRAVPSGRKRVAYRKLATGLAWLGLYVVYSGKYNYGVGVQDWFAQKPFLFRFLYWQVCGTMERSKYYALWMMTEGAAIFTGLGFTGYSLTGASQWAGASNVDVLQIEFAPNFKVLLDSWNKNTNVWLRECVYKRVTPKGKKPGFRSSMMTFGTSALWHGISPGYYLSFLFGGFVTTLGRLCRSHIRPLLLPAPRSLLKTVYDVLGTVMAVSLCNFATGPFMLGTLPRSFRAWYNLDFYGVVVVGAGLAFFWSGGGEKLKAVQARRVGTAAAAVQAKGEDGTTTSYQVPSVDVGVKEVEARVRRQN
ncbi:MBOAT-domain-containing protein [Punctularia strigosozonata HHB-11173 SS5]|uniref:MBOAT-domain-containing protein n=1 Tax=Punctularia strigosozonata (strain HHB-11173) TaxID=741275 RepID=UPI0004416562|nr:MBOAT-domain-containing protein [Punctularia strigosozonata HHB-11173 SS5]EIN10257.1 MBOAT-domain-containing protein [Punctularia strigosozonata HHB-11173 SS5]